MSNSEFMNVLGEDKNEKFTNCSVSSVPTEGRLIAVNSEFLAMAWSNMGEVMVVDFHTPFRIKPDQPHIIGHHANILDLEFSPFSSDLLGCTFDDYSVLLYRLHEGGLKEHLTKEVQLYQKHTGKANFVTFNPVASDVVCSGAFGGEVHVWNALKGETYVELKADNTPTMVQWNENGTLIGVTTKSKLMNVFDPRSNKMVFKQQINEGSQSPKFAWVDTNLFATTSWNKAGVKLLKLWDVRKVKEDLTSEGQLTYSKIDTSKTVTTPFVDRESKLLYCIGKGESVIHIYDYSEGIFKKGIDYKSAEPSIYSVLLERKALDYNSLEVDRFVRYVNSKKVYIVNFSILRRNPGFDPSLYPPVECGEAALTYNQWVNGETAEPVRKDINTIDNKFVSNGGIFVQQEGDSSSSDKVKELEGKVAELYTSQTSIDSTPEQNKNIQDNNFENKNEQNLINEINQLKKELENYIIENQRLKNDLARANKIIENLQKNQNENSNIESLKDENKNLKNLLYLKENEINQMKLKIKNNNTKDNYVKLDDIMVINFTSIDSSINHEIKCKVTDTFAEVEEKLYQIYDEFRNTNNMFTIKGRTILRFKNLKENDIRDGDKVLLFKIDK